MYRQVYQNAGAYQQSYNKSMQYPLVGSNNYGYVQASSLQHQQMLYNTNLGQYGVQRAPKSQLMSAQNTSQKMSRGGGAPPSYQKSNGYQLKVGGVVVGSWANGARGGQASRMNRAGMVS